MKPTPIRWAGSSDAIDVYLLEQRSQEMFYKLAEHLASMLPYYWPPQLIPGVGYQSVDQQFKWRAILGEMHDARGTVVFARHTSSGDNIISVGIAKPTEPGYSEVLVQTKGYCSEEVNPVVLDMMRAGCALPERGGRRLAEREKEIIVWRLI